MDSVFCLRQHLPIQASFLHHRSQVQVFSLHPLPNQVSFLHLRPSPVLASVHLRLHLMHRDLVFCHLRSQP